MCCHGYKKPIVFERLDEKERKIADIIFNLSNVEVRYEASCHHTPSDDKWGDLEREVYEQIERYALNGRGMKVKGVTFLAFFPLLSRVIREYGVGLREDRSFQAYFEGMEEWSHNLVLYKMFGDKVNVILANPHRYDEKFKELVEHVEKCCVRLGELDSKGSIIVHSPFGKKEENIDLEKYLKNEKDLRFFTVHGNVAVRKLNPEDPKDKRIIEDLRKLPEVWRR